MAEKPESPIFGYAGLIAGLGAIGISAILAVMAVYEWLKYGAVERLSFAQLLFWLGIRPGEVDWVGLQKVLSYIYESPSAAVLFFGGFALMWIGGSSLEAHDRALREYYQKNPKGREEKQKRDREFQEVRDRERRKRENRERREAARKADQPE